MRKFLIGLVIAVILTLTLYVFYALKRSTIANQLKYPPSKDCSSVDELFSNVTEYYTFAAFDKNSTRNTYGAGVY